MFGINKTLFTNLFGFALISVAFFLPEIAFTFFYNASEQTIDVSLPFNQIFLNQLISKAFIRLSSMWEFHAGLCWSGTQLRDEIVFFALFQRNN